MTFVICTESGLLEQKSLLLCSSIRKFGGHFRGAPIVSYSPRLRHHPSAQTLKKLEDLEVVTILGGLNKKYSDYPLANKIFAGAEAEKRLQSERLVFLDSDTIIVNEPVKLLLEPDHQVGAVPVWNTDIGSTGPEDPNDEYWMKLYALLGVEKEVYIRPLSKPSRPIRGYWNSGVISARRSCGVFNNWLDNFDKCWSRRIFPPISYFTEEATFAGTILAMFPNLIQELPRSYNYPLMRFRSNKGLTSLNQATIFHYSRLLKRDIIQVREFFRMWFSNCKLTEKHLWLKEELKALV